MEIITEKRSYPHDYLYHWTAVVALTTCIAGLFSILEGVGGGPALFLPDVPGGCILLMISALFATAYQRGRDDRPGWIAFSYIGALLLMIFAGCTVLIELGNYVTSILQGNAACILFIISSSFIWAAILVIPLLVGVSRLLAQCACGGDGGE